jgi:hypothetical protein
VGEDVEPVTEDDLVFIWRDLNDYGASAMLVLNSNVEVLVFN